MNEALLELDSPPAPIFDNAVLLSFGEQPDAAQKYEKFVAFFLGSNRFCIPAAAVAEVVQPLPVSPLPNAPAVLAGIVGLKGNVIAVLDIKMLLGETGVCREERPKLIVLRRVKKSAQFAFSVDAMQELISVPADKARPSKGSAATNRIRRIDHQDCVFQMIEPQAIFEEFEKCF